MENVLLATKLFIPPPRPGLVSRPRLFEKLNAALNASLALISAPAGFGKTTLLSEWVSYNQTRIHISWLSLEASDNDPVVFWSYFITALKTIRPAAGEKALAFLHASTSLSIESILITLINDLANITQRYVLILDDYHYIKSPDIHQGINFVLEHLPPEMHLVISTREDPPLSLARFRGKGTLLEIGTDDLRFTGEEATRLLKDLQCTVLTIKDINAINSRTEGWAVGLKMAALSMGKRKDISQFLSDFSGSQRYIMDYLLEEVLHQQSQEVQDFLLNTSILEKLSGPLCDAVTGRVATQTTLLDLEQANLFVIPLDESKRWYRYEHLFAELLRHQLETLFGKEKTRELHKLASLWYEKNELPDDAIRHSTTAQDWDRVIHLISANSTPKIMRNEQLTIVGWLQAIPEEVLQSYHESYLFYGLLVVDRGHIEIAERCFSYLKPIIGDDSVLSGRLATLQFFIARARGDFKRIIELGEKALSRLPPEDFGWRCMVSMYLGMVQWESGNLKESERVFKETYNTALLVKLTNLAAICLGYLGCIAFWQGKVQQALDMLKQSLALDDQSAAAAFPLSQLGFIHYELGDLETGGIYLQRALEFCRLSSFSELTEFANINLARIRMAQGDMIQVQRLMDESDHYVHRVNVSTISRIRNAVWHFYLALLNDNKEALFNWCRRVEENIGVLPFYTRHIPIRLLIAEGKKIEAAAQLPSLVAQAIQNNWLVTLLTLRIYQSLAAPSDREALVFLEEALTMARPEGYIRTFVDEGKLLEPLLKKALAQGITTEYTSRLLNTIHLEQTRRQADIKGPPESTNSLLSDRELEVLRFMAAGLTNQQIAEKLVISLSTAKTHVSHILEKMIVQSRTEAIARAREQKLI